MNNPSMRCKLTGLAYRQPNVRPPPRKVVSECNMRQAKTIGHVLTPPQRSKTQADRFRFSFGNS